MLCIITDSFVRQTIEFTSWSLIGSILHQILLFLSLISNLRHSVNECLLLSGLIIIPDGKMSKFDFSTKGKNWQLMCGSVQCEENLKTKSRK